jgi:hypothetical protein
VRALLYNGEYVRFELKSNMYFASLFGGRPTSYMFPSAPLPWLSRYDVYTQSTGTYPAGRRAGWAGKVVIAPSPTPSRAYLRTPVCNAGDLKYGEHRQAVSGVTCLHRRPALTRRDCTKNVRYVSAHTQTVPHRHSRLSLLHLLCIYVFLFLWAVVYVRIRCVLAYCVIL